MPTYRIIRQLPQRLEYRDATVVLEYVQREGDHVWALQARKLGYRQEPCIIAESKKGRYYLEAILNEGFLIKLHSPAAAIMERLCREHYVEASDREVGFQ